ncbi:MAG: Acylphosphatase [Elusimicrobia bacterium ADurb.Bin231]|nr:MAG: Acylphosphatase [Elusimicrobia bacterium ADurb.Bin231]
MLKYRIIVTGRVQGIGYRYFVVNAAKKYCITGWVRNLLSEQVEALAEGEEADINDFLEYIKTKHPYALVKNVTCSKSEIKKPEFSDFRVNF